MTKRRSIEIDYSTATVEDMRRIGEQIARADHGEPWWEILGEPEPPKVMQSTMLERLLRLTSD